MIPLPTGATDALAEAVDRFADGTGGTKNVRSRTGSIALGGRALHLKTSAISLAPEAEALRAAEVVGAIDGASSISLVRYFPERNVLVTGHVVGTSLFNTLWNGLAPLAMFRRRREDDCRRIVERAAGWLAAFHARGRTMPTDPALVERLRSDIVASISRKLAVLRAEAPEALSERDSERLLMVSLQEAATTGWEALPYGRVHGDFTHVNVLVVGADAVCVLDFADSRTGFHLEDIVRYWTAIWEIEGCGRRRSRALAPCLPSILRLNGLPAEAVETAPFRLLRIWNAVTMLLVHGRVARQAGWSHRRVVGSLMTLHRGWIGALLNRTL